MTKALASNGALFWQVLGAFWALVVGLATIVVVFPAFGVDGEELGDAAWPIGTVVVLALLLVSAFAYILVSLRSREIDAADQALLTDVLHVLSRRSIRLIEDQDFYASWPAITKHSAMVFAHEFGNPEHTFRDPALEKCRAALHQTAVKFVKAEAHHGFPSPHDGTWRNAGYSPSEAEGVPEREEAIERNARPILQAANEFLEAHERLVELARDRGYDLEGLKRDRHPRVQVFDDIVHKPSRKRWSDP